MAFLEIKGTITPQSLTQQEKFTRAVISNESVATSRLSWLTSNTSASQSITTGHG